MFELLDGGQPPERLPPPTYWNDPSYRFDVLLDATVMIGVALVAENLWGTRISGAELLAWSAVAAVAGFWVIYRYVRLTRRALRDYPQSRGPILISALFTPPVGVLYVYARLTKNDALLWTVAGLIVAFVGWHYVARRRGK
jgi:hypothetical protein